MVEEIKLALVVSFELVMTSVFILIVTVASFDGTIKEVSLEWVDGVVVVIVDFKGVVVNDVVDVDIVVFEGVVVVDLVVDVDNAVDGTGAAHVILKSPPLPPVEKKTYFSSTVYEEYFSRDVFCLITLLNHIHGSFSVVNNQTYIVKNNKVFTLVLIINT